MTVAENIGFGLEMLGKPPHEVEAAVGQMLRLVRMEELKDRRTDQISGGQQQRVALARGLAPHPMIEKFAGRDVGASLSPEIVIPAKFASAGVFLPACPPDVQKMYTAIWTELQK